MPLIPDPRYAMDQQKSFKIYKKHTGRYQYDLP